MYDYWQDQPDKNVILYHVLHIKISRNGLINEIKLIFYNFLQIKISRKDQSSVQDLLNILHIKISREGPIFQIKMIFYYFPQSSIQGLLNTSIIVVI